MMLLEGAGTILVELVALEVVVASFSVHDWHSFCPSSGWYRPSEQGEHSLAPARLAKVPFLQGAQLYSLDPCVLLYLPASQSSQKAEPVWF